MSVWVQEVREVHDVSHIVALSAYQPLCPVDYMENYKCVMQEDLNDCC